MRVPLLTRRTCGFLLSTVATFLLLVASSCGGDDSDGGSSSSSTPDNSGSVESPVATPAGSPGGPEECSVSEKEIGLVAKLDFDEDGEFRAGGQFQQGDKVTARMRLINCSTNNTILYFNTTQRYEMTIEPEGGGDQDWNSSDGKEFQDSAETEVIPPAETVVYSEEWDQKDKAGEQVAPGIYKVSFLSVACGRDSDEDCRFGPIGRIEILPPES